MPELSKELVRKSHVLDSYQVQITRKYGVACQEPVRDPAILLFSPCLQYHLSKAGNACTVSYTASQAHGVSTPFTQDMH